MCLSTLCVTSLTVVGLGIECDFDLMDDTLWDCDCGCDCGMGFWLKLTGEIFWHDDDEDEDEDEADVLTFDWNGMCVCVFLCGVSTQIYTP